MLIILTNCIWVQQEITVKIILLSGGSSTGKSTALKLLYDKLIGSGKWYVVSKEVPTDSVNFECILKYNNKSVAIQSDGDVYQWCVEAMVKYANCDVLVLAYSDKFARSLKKVVSRYEYHCVIRKKHANDSDNERVCAEIIEQI
jgi:nicotinamide riboside kinase